MATSICRSATEIRSARWCCVTTNPLCGLHCCAGSSSVLSLHGDSILRLKGIVRLQDETRPIVLQGVHHVLHAPMYLERPVQPEGTSRIVLITRGLSGAGLRASFATALQLTR